MPDDSRNPLARLFNTAREVMYGMASHDMSRYALRLVPYVLEVLPMWQRRVLRERHPLESEEFDLHGV